MTRRRFIASSQFASGVAVAFAAMAGGTYVASSMVSGPQSAPPTFTCSVTRVHDGDGPIWCAERQKVRLTAVAAREIDETCNPGQPCPTASGAAAKKALWNLARGQKLTCEQTGTSYQRITAWCWRPDGLELNCAMVKTGTVLRWEKFDRQRRMCR